MLNGKVVSSGVCLAKSGQLCRKCLDCREDSFFLIVGDMFLFQMPLLPYTQTKFLWKLSNGTER